MKRWRRTASFGVPTISLMASVHVVSVTYNDGNNSVIWLFDQNIVTQGSADGFTVNGDVPTSEPSIGTNFVEYGAYGDNPLAGSPWQMIAASCVGWIFANGGSLVDSTGTVL